MVVQAVHSNKIEECQFHFSNKDVLKIGNYDDFRSYPLLSLRDGDTSRQDCHAVMYLITAKLWLLQLLFSGIIEESRLFV